MTQATATSCCSGTCQPASSFSRRSFLQLTGATTALAALSRFDASAKPVAGPYVKEDFLKLIPLDKKLDPAWVASLTARGEPETFTGDALEHIGMPVGGLFSGNMYLGGDGRLWLWDIFNNRRLGIEPATHTYRGRTLNAVAGNSYVSPLRAGNYRYVAQGFSLAVRPAAGEIRRTLDADAATGFREVSFTGEYPIGTVRYRDPGVPVEVKLEAFSPFSPLNVKDSSLPLTVFSFELKNTGKEALEVVLEGLLENAVFHDHRYLSGVRRATHVATPHGSLVALTAARNSADGTERPDVLLEDWSKPTFAEAGWTVEGEAFGQGPVAIKDLPHYMGEVGGNTAAIANSHAGNRLPDATRRDAAKGRLISKPFTIQRNFILCQIAGGGDIEGLGLRVIVGGQTVARATGRNANKMATEALDVSKFIGRTAHIEIVDDNPNPWGNTSIGRIWSNDQGLLSKEMLKRMPDAGSMAIALLGAPAEVREADGERPLSEKLVTRLGRRMTLEAGAQATVDFLIAWHFPHAKPLIPGRAPQDHDRQYAESFADAAAVVNYAAENFSRLAGQTRLWRDTWYDSSLPHWFLNRTFANTSILASSTCFLFRGGRFYADEGVGCCPGTCTHVWQYAQAPGRLFPEIERNHREFVDFGKALTKDGVVKYRGEHGDWFAVDGQAGRILGVYREHQMSADDGFLKRVWPATKKAMGRMIVADADNDGIMRGPLHNTLDADWTGIVPWVNGMYHAALKACEIMAGKMGDTEFARKCADIRKAGMANLDKLCWRDDYGYYIQIGDPAKPTEVGSYEGCHIDTVLGQSWAYQVGIGEVITRDHARRCLESLWKYNFTPDVGPFRDVKKLGRWYAMPGEGGTIMLSNPFAPDIKFTGRSAGTQQYFNECMSGFEHQVAAHMMWENMLTESLAVTRVIHDRYHPRLRNPYNEIECSDHYARAMASYGTYLAACGFECDGPSQHLGFAPRLTPENFKCAFTSAEGWGTFSQKTKGGTLEATLAVKHGRLPLKTLALALPDGGPRDPKITATLDGKPVAATVAVDGRRATVSLEATLVPGQRLEIALL